MEGGCKKGAEAAKAGQWTWIKEEGPCRGGAGAGGRWGEGGAVWRWYLEPLDLSARSVVERRHLASLQNRELRLHARTRTR